jgi:hypothetical protein
MRGLIKRVMACNYLKWDPTLLLLLLMVFFHLNFTQDKYSMLKPIFKFQKNLFTFPM